MSSSATNEVTKKAKPISHAATLRWVSDVLEVVRSMPGAELLDFDGIDGLDVMLSPIFLTVLDALRRGPTPRATGIGRLRHVARDLGYDARVWIKERRAVRQSARPAQADIVLWSRHDSHSDILRPVGNALRARGTSCQVVACQFNVFETLVRSGETLYPLAAFPQIVRAARNEGARRAKQLAALPPWKLPEFPHPHGSDLGPIVRKALIKALPFGTEAIFNAQAICAELKPKVLVLGNDLTMEGRAGCRVAASHGITTATFMHGAIAADAFHALHCSDRLFVCGQAQVRELMQYNIDPGRIVVCGAPNMDARPRQTGRIHPALVSKLGLRQGQPWILVATSGAGYRISPQHHEQVVAGVLRLSAALGDVPVVAKLHPKDRLEYYQAGLKGGNGRFSVVTKKDRGFPPDIFDWLHGCSMLLTCASASAVEAMLMDVPVITMDYCGETAGIDFIDAGATWHVRTPEALEQAARELLAGGMPDDLRKRVQAYLQDSFFALDGGSAARGAEALCELAEGKTPSSGQTP